MDYFGIFLILVAAGLRLVGHHLIKQNRPRPTTATMWGIHSVPPGAAALLVASVGIFIFATSISSR